MIQKVTIYKHKISTTNEPGRGMDFSVDWWFYFEVYSFLFNK